jgi:hypothetical protein
MKEKEGYEGEGGYEEERRICRRKEDMKEKKGYEGDKRL